MAEAEGALAEVRATLSAHLAAQAEPAVRAVDGDRRRKLEALLLPALIVVVTVLEQVDVKVDERLHFASDWRTNG